MEVRRQPEEPVLSSLHVGSRDGTQVVRLGSMCLCLLNHFISPRFTVLTQTLLPQATLLPLDEVEEGFQLSSSGLVTLHTGNMESPPP